MANDCRSNTKEYSGGAASHALGAAIAGAKKKKKKPQQKGVSGYLKPKKKVYKELDKVFDY